MMTKNKLEISLPSDLEIKMSRVFNAPRELVWDFFTDPGKLKLWLGCEFGRATVSEADFKVGGTWRFEMELSDGGLFPTKGEFLEIEKPSRLVRTYIYDVAPYNEHPSTETLTLEEQNGKTEMTVVIKHLTKEARDGHYASGLEKGAGSSYDKLDVALETAVVEARKAVFVIEREFKAPRQLVWDCWTKKELFAGWFGPKGCDVEILHSEVKEGGYNHVRITMGGNVLYGKYDFSEVSPIERLVYTNAFADREGNLARHPMSPNWPLKLLTTVEFSDRGATTHLELTWSPIDATDEEAVCFAAGLDSCRMGWGGSFEQLDDLLRHVKGEVK